MLLNLFIAMLSTQPVCLVGGEDLNSIIDKETERTEGKRLA